MVHVKATEGVGGDLSAGGFQLERGGFHMEMKGQKLIPETREAVWRALNDPNILRSCVPGCQSLEKTSDTEMEAVAAIRVGPVSAKFSGKISLSELNAPVSYRITGEGQGGVAGFAKGSAFVTLDEVDGGTLLSYSVDAQIGGKLAQLGGRLVDATARKLSEAFFDKFATEIRRQYHSEGAAPISAASAGAGAASTVAAQQAGHAPVASQDAHHAVPPAAHPAPAGGSRAGFLVALAMAAIFAFLWLTGLQGGVPAAVSHQALSPEFGSAVQLILIAAVGYLFGRLSERRH
ncbi:SRPBCC family protein [Neoaquamicrobium microcysteis]